MDGSRFNRYRSISRSTASAPHAEMVMPAPPMKGFKDDFWIHVTILCSHSFSFC